MVNKITSPITPLEEVAKINEIIDGKQDTLVSGTNIKTVNNSSLLGSGNIAVGTVTSVNNVSPVNGNVTLSIPTVDQTYSASSTNAQSGVAINGAKFLRNTATGSNAVTILGNATTAGSAVNIGYGSSVGGGGGVAIGRVSSTSGSFSTALGYSAKASANYAIQLGYGTNSTASTLAVGFNNTNYQLLDGTTGKIPSDRIPIDNSTITVNSSGQLMASGGGGASRNIGEIIQSTIPLTDAGLHLLDGGIINGSGAYADFVTHIAGLVSGHSELFTTEANWQTSVTNYGVCGKFVYDSVNNTVRLPKITGFTEGTIDPTVLGDLTEAGLPNITSGTDWTNTTKGTSTDAQNGAPNNDGCFVGTSSGGHGIQSNAYSISWSRFDASNSNSIYGNSSTVQPQSIKVLYYIVIATSTKTEIEVDIDEVMTDLNGKVDIADLATCHVVVETYHNGASWYRVYSDGWCEQGGYYANSSSGVKSFTLLKPYNDTNYFLECSSIYTSNGSTDHQESMNEFVSKSTTGFGKYIWVNSTNFWWKASGYIR